MEKLEGFFFKKNLFTALEALEISTIFGPNRGSFSGSLTAQIGGPPYPKGVCAIVHPRRNFWWEVLQLRGQGGNPPIIGGFPGTPSRQHE